MNVGGFNTGLRPREPMRVLMLSDFHVGNINFNREALHRAVQFTLESVKEVPHTYVTLGGDIADCITTGDRKRWDAETIDRRYPIEALANLPAHEVDDAIDILRPIADRVVVCLLGNHEFEYMRRHSNGGLYKRLGGAFPRLAATQGMMDDVGLFRFSATSTSNKGVAFDFALEHGVGGGGKTPGYKLNIVHDVFRWYTVDVAAMGHIHRLAADWGTRISLSHNGKSFQQTRCWFCATGTFLEKHRQGSRNYFAQKPGPSSDIGLIQVDISYQERTVRTDDGRRNGRFFKTIECRPRFMD